MAVTGLVHGELTSLLWGGAFGFVWAYVVAAGTLANLPPAVRRPQGALEVLPGAVLRFRTPTPPVAPAFFTWYLSLEAVHSPSRKWVHRVPMVEKETLLDPALPRGRYAVTARWELVDGFGFWHRGPVTTWVAEATVAPAASAFVPPPPPPTRAGTWHPRRSGRRSGDPFDVRKYTPGDDLRRLHWALFAHSGVPFVRTADPSPPPSGHLFLVLDTEAISEEALDARLSALVAWLADLEARGTRWTVVVPSVSLVLRPGDPVGAELAALVPAPLPDHDIDPTWPAEVVLLTGPESPGAARLTRALSRRRCHPVEVPPPPVDLPGPRPWWRRRS